MIDPTQPTNFNRTKSELEEWLLFCIVVAGKNAHQQAKKLDAFLALEEGSSPFIKIQKMYTKGTLVSNLETVRMGQYRRIVWAFHSVSLYDVHSLNLVTLQNIAGIGLKTARFYWMNCVPNQNYAILDTHILKWLRMQGYDVPKSTPSKNKYLKIEQIFLEEAKKRNKTPIELDLEIWLSYAKKQEIEQSVKSAITEEAFADLSFLPIPTQNCV